MKWLQIVEAVIEKHLHVKKEGSDYYGEIYVDYRDKDLSEQTIAKILEATSPRDQFFEILNEWECNQLPYELAYVEAEIKKHLDWEIVDKYWDEIEEWINEHFHFHYDPKDFSASILMDIIVDTGDANYDYILNCVFPHYNGQKDEILSNEASILWLAKQQGYTKRQLNNALRNQEFAGSKFLESMHREVLNCTSHMNALTFMVSLSLEEAMDLLEQYHAEEKLNQSYTLTERKGRGYMMLCQSTTCGLYDAWMGGGSMLEIVLEKDVKLPFRCIRSLAPDVGDRSIKSVYGVIDSMWTSNAITMVHPMKKTA